jgi:hypothetical protein
MLTENAKIDVWLLESCLKRSGFTTNSIEFIIRAVESHTVLLEATKNSQGWILDGIKMLRTPSAGFVDASDSFNLAIQKLKKAIIKAEGK